MNIVCVGGGPAGLYTAILMKKARPDASIRVIERNKSGDTFGFGVVFSDATLDGFRKADAETYDAITKSFWHWDDIDIHYRGEVLRSTGHGFCGMSRRTLLRIFEERALGLGVVIDHEIEIKSMADVPKADVIVIGDGVNSVLRNELKEKLEPSIDWRPNRFVWLGTDKPFDAFTFYFNQNEHGLFQVHAYRYEPGQSTFIVECSDKAFFAAGLDRATEAETIAYFEKVFEKELAGHKLIANRSLWRQFPTINLKRWHAGNAVILGDAAHTAHYSIGSGTKLAMEDAMALSDALLAHNDVPTALEAYERARRPAVDSIQRAAQVSLEWFESTPRYMDLDPIAFAESLLTRSLRVTHDNLKKRDPVFAARVEAQVAAKASAQTGRVVAPSTPPMFTPFKLRDLVLDNRVVLSPMCQYSAVDGTVDDWHLVHLGSRAVGGAGLLITEMTNVSADGRITPGCAGMYQPAHVGAWKRITDFVKKYSSAKIGVQLAHAGRKGATKRAWEGIDQPLASGGWPLIAASELPYLPVSDRPRAMTRADMDRVKADFVRSTQMADEAGFDLVEVHMAHGYLLATFLSPVTNKRTDEYGGSIENRLRFPLEVLDAVRAAWPLHKPISVRISAEDWIDGGTTGEDAVVIARAIAKHGGDIIDVSSGQTSPEEKPRYGRLFQVPFSDRIKREAGVPTMTVGNISSYADVNSILAAERADLCVLARAHLFDPYWTRHAAHAQGYPLPWPPQYASLTRYSPRFE